MTGFAGLASCVHCGFCLQSCPTFLVTGDEADGPRGRIVLMQQLARGDLLPDDRGLTLHLDRCLGCRACEPVCPSGVEYGPALEAARERIATRRPVSPLARLVLHVMAQPMVRQPVLRVARILRPLAARLAGRSRLGFGVGMLAASRRVGGRLGGRADGRLGGRAGEWMLESAAPPAHPPIRRTAIFAGCIQSDLFSHVNAAAARTLTANGMPMVPVASQGCCGALHAHAGLLDDARVLARANVRAFAAAPDALIAVTAAGCGAMLRGYGELLADDPLAPAAEDLATRVRDVTELLADTGPRRGAALHLRVAYDAPCHLVHAQRVTDPPRTVLAAIPALDVTPHEEADVCCGSAGIYSLLEPALSRAVLRRKVDALLAVAPDIVATGNPGCVMQIGAGLRAAGVRTPVVHPVELLDRSYALAGFYGDPGVDSPDDA